jgi:hypothetical protein
MVVVGVWVMDGSSNLPRWKNEIPKAYN